VVDWSELVRTYERYDSDDAVAGGYQFVLESFTVPE
jgi:hypothetical protein